MLENVLCNRRGENGRVSRRRRTGSFFTRSYPALVACDIGLLRRRSRLFLPAGPPWQETSSRPDTSLLHKMADRVQPFLIPAQYSTPDLEPLIRLNFPFKITAHSGQDNVDVGSELLAGFGEPWTEKPRA